MQSFVHGSQHVDAFVLTTFPIVPLLINGIKHVLLHFAYLHIRFPHRKRSSIYSLPSRGVYAYGRWGPHVLVTTQEYPEYVILDIG